jgi:hypothetical protein
MQQDRIRYGVADSRDATSGESFTTREHAEAGAEARAAELGRPVLLLRFTLAHESDEIADVELLEEVPPPKGA